MSLSHQANVGRFRGGIMVQADVQWPSSPVAEDGNNLLSPLTALLLGLNILEDKDAEGQPLQPTLWSTPFSLQVITAGSTTISKWVGTAIAGLGGISSVLAGIRAFFFSTALGDNVKVGWAVAAAACLVATIFGLAIILRADIAGRAQASSAEYAARATVAAQFLALARPQGQYFAKRPGYGQPFMPVQSFLLQDGKIAVKVNDDTVLSGDQVEGLVPLQG